MKQIFAQIFYQVDKGQDAMLVTLIDDRGSAPRGAGSQMLLTAAGRVTGTIGGGAVEKRSEELGLTLLSEKRSLVHGFSLHKNAVEDIGMVCGGDVTAHFQYIPAGDAGWKELCAQASALFARKERGWFLLREDGGAPSLLDERGALLCGPTPPSGLAGKTALRREGYFSMPMGAGNRAILFGAGHISQALCPLLTTIDFRPVVFDCRAEYARADLFPGAEEVICGDYTRVADYLTIDENDFLVVMTNGHSHDFVVQEQVLRGPFAYVGVIGSRSKTASVNARLREAGLTEDQIARVHTPVGTAIRAVTPEEIAVSIAGEMIYVRALIREGEAEPGRRCPMR